MSRLQNNLRPSQSAGLADVFGTWENQLGMLGPAGHPVRGPANLTKDDEFEQMQTSADYASKVFLLPDEQEEYNKVKTSIARGVFLQNVEKIEFDRATNKFVILLGWIVPYALQPGQKPPA